MMQETVDSLCRLLDSCDRLSTEAYLKPFHLAAFMPLRESVEVTLVKKLYDWKYRPVPGSHLILEKLNDWKAEFLSAPFFSSGLDPDDERDVPGLSAIEASEEHSKLKSQFLNLILTIVSPDVRGYRLSSIDTAGQMLCPYGGCHDYFVLVDREFALLFDFDWDS